MYFGNMTHFKNYLVFYLAAILFCKSDDVYVCGHERRVVVVELWVGVGVQAVAVEDPAGDHVGLLPERLVAAMKQICGVVMPPIVK